MALPDALGLARLNELDASDARAAFLAICSSPRWADQLTQGRPYPDDAAVHTAADSALAGLSEADIADALGGHARIGAQATGEHGAWSRQEQAGMSAADESVARAMAEGNAAYDARFGRLYLVSAAGKSAEQLLAILQQRLGNDPDTEREVVRGELATINRLRLQRMLAVADGRPDRVNLTTHVLDAASGRPAVGVPVRLEDLAGGVLGRGRTNDDGRIPAIVAGALAAGSYRLVFDTAAYHASVGTTGFYPEVVITFTITDPQQHHHVPLLLAPFAYSTYRGS